MKRLILALLVTACPSVVALDQATRCMAHTLVEIAHKMACANNCLEELNPMVEHAHTMLDKGMQVDDETLEAIINEFAQGPMYRKSCCYNQSSAILVTIQNQITALSAQLTAAQAALTLVIQTTCI